MKFWINKNSEVSIREQLVTQIRLGIAAGDIAPGERLPSTRELARRFGIHANTVSAAFRELVRRGVVERRPGSGVFAGVRAANVKGSDGLELMLREFVASAARKGYGREQIESAMRSWASARPRPRIALVEPDSGLRKILAEEIFEITGQRPVLVDPVVGDPESLGSEMVIAAMGNERPEVAGFVAGRNAVIFRAASVPRSMNASDRPKEDDLIAVVSCWEQFLSLARVYLLAANVPADSLMVRNTDQRRWAAGLDAASLVVCDAATGRRFPHDPRVRVFRLIGSESISELKLALM